MADFGQLWPDLCRHGHGHGGHTRFYVHVCDGVCDDVMCDDVVCDMVCDCVCDVVCDDVHDDVCDVVCCGLSNAVCMS